MEGAAPMTDATEIRRGHGAGALGRWLSAGALTAALSVAPGPAAADGFFEFEDLTEPQLFELFMAVGDELIARGVLPDLDSAVDAHAAFLTASALGLERIPTPSGAPQLAEGPAGGRYLVRGVRRMPGGGPTPPIGPLGDAGPAFDVLALVLLSSDNRIERGVLIPADTARPRLDADGMLPIDATLFSADGVTDITPQLFRAVSAGEP